MRCILGDDDFIFLYALLLSVIKIVYFFLYLYFVSCFLYFLFLVIVYVFLCFILFSLFDCLLFILPPMTSDEIELFRLTIDRGDGVKLMPFYYDGFKYRTKGRADDVYKKGRGVYRCSDPLCRATFTVRRKQVGNEDVFLTYSLPLHNHSSRDYERKHEMMLLTQLKNSQQRK